MTTDPAVISGTSTDRERPPLPPEVAERLGDLAAICRRYRVRTLWLFGSAVQGTFDPATSDLDFLVDLGEYEPTVAERYGGLYMALADLFSQRIDLVTVRSNGSSRIMDHIRETRRVLYAA